VRLSRAGHANRRGDPLQALRGLYDPSYEHDACGVAFVARVGAPASHEVVARALSALAHLEHRGAEGADPDTGDGAGILFQLPDEFLRAETGFDLPEQGRYGVAVCFLPPGNPTEAMRLLERSVEAEGQQVLGWREVPVNEAACGAAARAVAPRIA
jgi:glutamate synthase (NADPH) large chain